MRRVLFLFVCVIGCSPPPLESALARYQPEDIAFDVNGRAVSQTEVDFWGDEQSARYAEKVVASSPALARAPRTVHAWKKGMVRAIIEDKVESQPIDMSDKKTIEQLALALRIKKMKPAMVRFSAVSLFAKREVEGTEPTAAEKRAAIDSFLPKLKPYRELLLKHPDRTTLQKIYDDLGDKVPKQLGVDLKTDARVLARGEPKQGKFLHHEKLAELTADGVAGDVPPLERAGFTALIVLVEGHEPATIIDQQSVQQEAEQQFADLNRTKIFEEFLTDVYGPANVKFHPQVIQDETKQ